MRVTLQDIARDCNVSVQTVSSILNRKGHLYREETRQKVLEAVERLGYRPNLLARGLRGGRTQTLGFVVPGLNASAVSNEKLRSIELAAQRHGYRLLIGSYESEGAQRIREHVRDFLGMHVDGLIYWASAIDDEAVIQRVREANTPLVVIEPPQDYGVPSVGVDRAHGGYLQARHLHEIGRRRIAYLFTGSASFKTQQKIEGVRRALAEVGQTIDPDLCVQRSSASGAAPRVGAEMTRELLERDRPFDAVLTLSDSVAMGAMTELVRHGLRVPEDVAIIGYDDDAFADYTIVPLSTVHQPRDLGSQVLDLLVAQIEPADEADHPVQAISLKPHLVVRESTVPRTGALSQS